MFLEGRHSEAANWCQWLKHLAETTFIRKKQSFEFKQKVETRNI